MEIGGIMFVFFIIISESHLEMHNFAFFRLVYAYLKIPIQSVHIRFPATLIVIRVFRISYFRIFVNPKVSVADRREIAYDILHNIQQFSKHLRKILIALKTFGFSHKIVCVCIKLYFFLLIFYANRT